MRRKDIWRESTAEEKPHAGLLFYVGWIVGLLVWTAALVLAIPLIAYLFHAIGTYFDFVR